MLLKIQLVLTSLFLASCASVQSISMSSVPSDRSQKVEAISYKTIFMGFNFSNDYVDEVVQKLSFQCPQGAVEGILTKQENINYFLYFIWRSQIKAQGYCVEPKSQKMTLRPAENATMTERLSLTLAH